MTKVEKEILEYREYYDLDALRELNFVLNCYKGIKKIYVVG